MSYTATAQALIRLSENSQVGEARRNAARIAELTALNETDRGKAAIVATELANNLLRHATGGELLISRFQTSSVDGVELLAIDRGPGMADIGKCLEDGYSTGGTAGTGFGAIRRLSSDFDVYSSRPAGTVTLSRILTGETPPKYTSHWGVICLPAPNETLCGDNWSIAENEGVISIIIADGLGHGPLAAKASDEAIRIFNQDPFRQPGQAIEAMHSPLRSTRGAAIALARIDTFRHTLKYSGAGNIAGSLITGDASRGLFSHNGTVGLQMRKVQEFDYPWSQKALLIMHSDGLQTRWDPANFPGLMQRHPTVIAGVLYRDFKRGADDVTIAVVREGIGP